MSFNKLYRGATEAARTALDADPTSISIATRTGSTLQIQMPPVDSSLSLEEDDVVIDSPSCFVDVLCILRSATARMTRAAIVQALEEAGTRWSDGSVGKALGQAQAIKAVDNRQDVSPKGYAIVGRFE